jgi:glycerophosphoryl diester phosphodiesterase
LPSFEVALDACVTSIETDLHLTSDDQVVVCHDAMLSGSLFRHSERRSRLDLANGPLLRTITLAQARRLVADINPDPVRFPGQHALPTPAATAFAGQRSIDVFGIPTLDDLFDFVAAYAGHLGQDAGKSDEQRMRAARLIFDLELKRVPGRPERIDDGFDGNSAGVLENQVLACIQGHGVLKRTVIRSFDHRSVLAIKQREPQLKTAILVAGTAPVVPSDLARRAGASCYCPDVHFLDQLQVQQCHAAGIAVLPWTANDPADWDRLLSWGVDGITTDYPDLLAAMLRQRGIQH